MTNEDKRKILIVDDDKFLLDMYSIKFTESGFNIETAFSGAEALERVEKGFRPDIYLVDIVMPTMDGFELIRQMKAKKVDLDSAVVVLSNLGQKDDIEKALSLGVDGYIVKASATPSEVVAKVIEIFNKKKGQTKWRIIKKS